MRIGAHLSVAGGLSRSIDRAVAIGCECLQIFLSPPQAWQAPRHAPEEAERFKQRRRAASIDPVFAHSVYLINLASASTELRQRSIDSLIAYLTWAQRLDLDGVITHVGSARDTRDEALHLVVEALQRVLAASPCPTPLLLETTAGHGAIVGNRFEELAAFLDAMGRPPRLQVCLDTSHVFASGLFDGTEPGLMRMLKSFDATVGLDRLAAIHLNDSKVPFGAHVDRHANLGEGHLGRAGIRVVLRHPALRHLPFILEVPGEGDGPDRNNVALAKLLAGEEDSGGDAGERAAGEGRSPDEGSV